MEYVLIIASLVTAFIAGIAALFAPCCITVLLPAYFGSIFRQKRTIMLMTLVFFMGLLAVFLPLGLGFAALGVLFSKYHNLIFVSGGIFLLFLGISILLGMHFSLSFSHPKMKVQNAASVFVLGIFSAFATLCCAPVLAGVLALSILPGSIFWGGVYALAYPWTSNFNDTAGNKMSSYPNITLTFTNDTTRPTIVNYSYFHFHH